MNATNALPPIFPADADPVLGPILDRFRACLCGELAAGGRPVCNECGCCFYPGDSMPPATACDCHDGGQGQAWVRIVRWDEQQTGNRQDMRRCQQMRLRVVLEAGVYRCVSVVGADGQSPPNCEQRDADFWGLLHDAFMLRRAVACCEALRGHGLEVFQAAPTGVRGGCAGQRIEFAIDV